jgi:hypothetical protein
VTVAPGKSRKVKAELRTVAGEEGTEGRLFEVQGLRDGKATPTEAKTTPEEPAVFTFTAPQKKCSKSDAPGFRVFNSSSKAGRAGPEEWEINCAYVLEFKSHIIQEPLNIVNPQFGMQLSSNGFDAHVEATVPLRLRDDGQWVGEGAMQYTTHTTTQPAQCEIRVQGTGKTTFHVKGGTINSDPASFTVNLIILPGQSGEVAETHCTSANTPDKLKELFASQGVQGGDAHGTTKGGGWSSAFNVTRFTRFDRAKGGYEIGGWTPGGDSDVIAKKTLRVNCSIGMQTCQEVTELTLRQGESAGSP